MKIVTAANAQIILPAIATVEKVGVVSVSVLDCLGVGIDDSSTFADADNKAEKTAWLHKYAIAIIDADKGAVRQIVVPPAIVGSMERKAAKVTAVVRMLRGIVASAARVEGSSPEQRITVVAKSEDESAYSHDFPGCELEVQQATCADYYGRQFHADFVPKMAVMKRMCYCVRIDHKLPSLARIPLSSLRVSANESTFIQLKRWCVGLCIIAVGMAPPTGFSSGGYGEINGTTLWLSWWDCLDLLDALETQLPALPDTAHASVIESIVTIVASATGQGTPRPTASQAIGQAVADCMRIIAAAKAADASSPHKRKLEDALDSPKLGPNGLERMKGGNPAGALCRDFGKARGCPRSLCSFAHVRPAPQAPPDAPPAPQADA